MTTSAIRKNSVVLGLAICLVLSSFHEVSCQSGAASSSDDVKRLLQGFTDQAGVDKEPELMDGPGLLDGGFNARNQNSEQAGGFESQTSATASSETVVEQEQTTEETREASFQGGGGSGFMINEPKIIGNEVGGDSDFMINTPENIVTKVGGDSDFMINTPENIVTKVGSRESGGQSFGSGRSSSSSSESASSRESRQQSSESRSSSSASSSIIGESGAWRCVDQSRNGGTGGGNPIFIPKYELSDIIKEETHKGSSSKTSSLITSLSQIVENHKKGRWTDVIIGKVSKTETSEKVTQLKMTLKRYVGVKMYDLVTRSNYEEILTMAARYEELTQASVLYVSKLASYGTLIKEGIKATDLVKTKHESVILHDNVAKEKQQMVDNEFDSVKILAQKGDELAVQIFAMKKTVMKLEAEKKEVDVKFQKIVENLSRVLEESSRAYEKHRVVVREWKEVQATVEYSRETVHKAEVVWVQFLNTL